jgi:hypothetical protein
MKKSVNINLYAHVKSIVAAQVCPVHRAHPVITFEKGKFNMNCCCADFKSTCYLEMAYILNEFKTYKSTQLPKAG